MYINMEAEIIIRIHQVKIPREESADVNISSSLFPYYVIPL